jgi:hypothetical protein
MTPSAQTPRLARLRGQLGVLLGVREELHAIGAPPARLEQNRHDIARIRAELMRSDLGDDFGDPADATRSRRS